MLSVASFTLSSQGTVCVSPVKSYFSQGSEAALVNELEEHVKTNTSSVALVFAYYLFRLQKHEINTLHCLLYCCPARKDHLSSTVLQPFGLNQEMADHADFIKRRVEADLAKLVAVKK
jgi:hypothetical protein